MDVTQDELDTWAAQSLPKRRAHKRRALRDWITDFVKHRDRKVKRGFAAKISEPLMLDYIERLLLSKDTDGHSIDAVGWVQGREQR